MKDCSGEFVHINGKHKYLNIHMVSTPTPSPQEVSKDCQPVYHCQEYETYETEEEGGGEEGQGCALKWSFTTQDFPAHLDSPSLLLATK